MNFKNAFLGLCDKASKYGPELLIGLGIAGYFTTVILAIKATPKAEDLIVQAEDEKEDSLTVIETVKAGWKPYIAPVITFLASTGCIIGAVKKKNDQHAELAAAYAISQAVAKKYQEKTEEIAGEEKAREIDSAVRKDVARSPMVQESVSKLPPSNIAGVHPFWDPLSNTAFYASINMMKNAEVELNRRLYTGAESYITIDDLYDELNEQGVYPPLKHTAISCDHGWFPDNGGIQFDIDDWGVPFEQGHWDDGTPCYLMTFKSHRQPEYIR